ncbi:MAG: PLP-dependent aminotransferase family protein [Candidatus Eisenbacteria bacterium]|nr:PLP-dependent aminotransferase family protein [Candidatus Eisenbacteria bacterium]
MTSWIPELKEWSGPRYRAIADALARDLAHGRLAPGDRLPTHRELARALGLTIGTVTRAYGEAERRGLVQGEVGRGTFIRHAVPAPDPFGLRVREGGDPGSIDLAINLPAPVGPQLSEALAATLRQVADDLAPDTGREPDLTAYQPRGGVRAHRAIGARWLQRFGVETDPDALLVFPGAQQAILIALASTLQPGETVLTEQLTYPGLKAAARLLHLNLHGLALDAEGIVPAAFERACAEGNARLLYTVPTLQNPTCVTQSPARRAEIAAIAERHGVLILEDDVHGPLLDSPVRPLLGARPDLGFYLMTLSKTVAPGLRIAFLRAPRERCEMLASNLWASTFSAGPLLAEVSCRWIEDGTADRLLRARRDEARRRHDLARDILRDAEFNAHPSGYHLWLQLPGSWRAEQFAAESARLGVSVNTPATFAVERGHEPRAVRVCLGAPATLDYLRTGLLRLRALLDREPHGAAEVV